MHIEDELYLNINSEGASVQGVYLSQTVTPENVGKLANNRLPYVYMGIVLDDGQTDVWWGDVKNHDQFLDILSDVYQIPLPGFTLSGQLYLNSQKEPEGLHVNSQTQLLEHEFHALEVCCKSIKLPVNDSNLSQGMLIGVYDEIQHRMQRKYSYDFSSGKLFRILEKPTAE